MKTSILLATLVASAQAGCPNSCSNRGHCGADNVCACFEGWKGGDCSYRVCPFGPSWSVVDADFIEDDRSAEDVVLSTPGGYISIDGDSNYDIAATYDELYPKVPAFRPYTECSSVGNCNYATGKCNCFAGYEGRGCRRASCPNDCSGHGKCILNSEAGGSAYNSPNIHNSQYWDKDRTQQCVCDRGFEGVDCASRVCPYGDNPQSECNEGVSDDYQLVYVQTDGTDDTRFFSLSFIDALGGDFTTRPIDTAGCDKSVVESCTEVQFALMDLPNFAIPNVEVDEIDLSGIGANADDHVYLVHFNDPATAGKQNTLKCDTVADSSVDGAAPKFMQAISCHVFHVGNPEWYYPSGDARTFLLNGQDVARKDILGVLGVTPEGPGTKYKENIPCSGRGKCNRETGTCKCSGGATGEGCRQATTYA